MHGRRPLPDRQLHRRRLGRRYGSLLDYETATSHSVTVTATSRRRIDQHAELLRQPHVMTPRKPPCQRCLRQQCGANSVSESAANGTAVGVTALATDADWHRRRSPTASPDTAGGRFQIDSSPPASSRSPTAPCSTTRPTPPTRSPSPRPRDDGSTSTQSFSVSLTDDTSESSVGAVSDSNVAANSVSESAANGTAVGVTALATDSRRSPTASATASPTRGRPLPDRQLDRRRLRRRQLAARLRDRHVPLGDRHRHLRRRLHQHPKLLGQPH